MYNKGTAHTFISKYQLKGECYGPYIWTNLFLSVILILSWYLKIFIKSTETDVCNYFLHSQVSSFTCFERLCQQII